MLKVFGVATLWIGIVNFTDEIGAGDRIRTATPI